MASEYQCKNCGGDMMGDGYTRALICEFVPDTDEVSAREADAAPLYCSLEDDRDLSAKVQACATGWLTGNLQDPEFRKLYECELLTESFLIRIEDEMTRQGLTRSELARRMGCSAANISQTMIGSGNMTVAMMVSLSLALNLRIKINFEQGDQ